MNANVVQYNQSVVAHLHYGRQTRGFGLRFRSISCSWLLGLEFESDSVQCENYIVQCSHWVWSPNPSPKSGSVNKSLRI